MLKVKVMKFIKLFLLICIPTFLLVGCTSDTYYDDYPQQNDLGLFIQQYDLWEVDYDATRGNGSVPFLDRAFTISFINRVVYANNNMSGFGYTGNGLGIDVGTFNTTYNTVTVNHDSYGYYTLEISYMGGNRIELYDRSQNTSYVLYGYNVNNYDYDAVFYQNMNYFLQEFQAWKKVYTSNYGVLNDFDNENFIKFLSRGNQFQSSTNNPNTGLNNISWRYTGVYDVFNINNDPYSKILTLDYDFWGNEEFVFTIVNDSRIRLTHRSSGTVYEFEGVGYIQYLKVGGGVKDFAKMKNIPE